MLKIRRRRTTTVALRLSIIIRTKDRPQLLTRSLRSLTEQKRRPDEIIVVNDGGVALDDVIAQFPDLNLHLINHATSQGRAKAGNIGVLAAQGDMIGFLDDDDIYLSDHLQRLEQVTLHFDAPVVYSGCRLMQRDLLGETVLLQENPLKVFNDGFDANRLRYENYIPLINLLIDRDLWLELNGFDEQFDAFEDWDMLIRLSTHCRFYHLNRITTEYAVWGNSQITREMDKTRWHAAYQQIIAKHILSLTEEQQLNVLTDYWMISQERRATAQDAQQDKYELQYKLQEKQLETLQLQNQLLEHREQSTAMQNRYENEYSIVRERYETEYTKLQALYNEQTQKFAQQETYFYQQQTALQQQLVTVQTAFTALQEEYSHAQQKSAKQINRLQITLAQVEEEASDLQQRAIQREQHTQQLQNTLHQLSKEITVGMGRPAFDRLLERYPHAYTLASSPDSVLSDYQHLTEWIRNKVSELTAWEQHQQQQFIPAITEDYQRLQAHIMELLHHLTTSRWHFVRRYRGLAEAVGHQAQQLHQHVEGYVNATSHIAKQLALTSVQKQGLTLPIPKPRPLSTVYPTYMCIAGSVEKPQFMEGVAKLGTIPFFLLPEKPLVFTTYCALNNFFRIDLLLATCVRVNPSRVRVLIRLLDTGDVVRDISFEAMEVFDNRYYPVFFEPLTDSMDKTYQIEIESPDATDSTCIAVWCHPNKPVINQSQQLSDVVIDTTPHLLPKWLTQKLLDLPFPDTLGQANAPHLFFITELVPSTLLLTLHNLITHLGEALARTKTQGQLVLSGTVSGEIQRYCQHHGITVLQTHTFLEDLRGMQQHSSGHQLLWRIAVTALPDESLIQQAIDIFTQTNVALLVPAEQQSNGIIRAGYAVVLSEGIIHCAPTGENIHHPYHRFEREIQAGNSTLITLRANSLKNANLERLNAYSTSLYQLTDLIWQLREQGLSSHYQATFCYYHEQASLYFTEAELNTDARHFYHHWQAALPTKHTFFANSLDAVINPYTKPSILVIDATLPTFDEDSGSLRMYCWLKMMVTMGYRVTFFADNQDGNPKYRHPLEQHGVEVFYGNYSIADALAHRHFNYAIICRVDVGHRYIPFVRLVSPKTKILYDTVDIHYVRELRRAEIENDPELVIHAHALKRKELANCLLADHVLTVTDDDGQHLQQELPNLAYSLVPNIHLPVPPAPTSYAERDGLVFIGNYNHQPNEDAVYYFIEHVLPKVQARLPDIKLYILGSHLRDKMRTLANQHIKIIGWVDKVDPEFAQRRVFVSYLRYGAGMKGKLGQALTLGLPVVSTTIGAEGMGLLHGETALIADDPDSFAEAVCRLYTDAGLWEKLANNGREYIEEHYGETAIKRYLQTLFERVKPT
ncbi:glycosyltransferase [Beggiatoa leptomitoformis]|uniref:Glycosyltransferase n=1 Tax=Beggiatoa leptomitoformis TaxID=288004 RepID=A0A2N9YI34_9GAMM|nr:glycosyltransferase [Beggiatoa leptomitoformis]AUI70198.1 glycosyltransferase [Beggiatoa leptomitoformis]QGX03626.1 glycosyltransferase [Beggiatoa leptomitoformis]